MSFLTALGVGFGIPNREWSNNWWRAAYWFCVFASLACACAFIYFLTQGVPADNPVWYVLFGFASGGIYFMLLQMLGNARSDNSTQEDVNDRSN